MLAEQLTDEEVTEILALALLDSKVDFEGLLRDAFDKHFPSETMAPEILEFPHG